MARMSVPTPTLLTARLRLRPVTGTDADALVALQSNARVLRYWDSPPWTDRSRVDRFFAVSEQLAEEGTGARLALERVADASFLGWCSVTRWNPEHRSASLGYCLAEAAWGQGYATEAAGSLLQWAFDTFDLNRVQAETDTRNLASARVLREAGVRAGRHAAGGLCRERRRVGLVGLRAAPAGVAAQAMSSRAPRSASSRASRSPLRSAHRPEARSSRSACTARSSASRPTASQTEMPRRTSASR